jgi:oxygen-independent coproporphyrinogen-3 oxidase
MSPSTVRWESALIQKYDRHSAPRYTSYPTAIEFTESYNHQAFCQAACRYPERPLSLYVHLPFCHQLCYFCACNKIITRQATKVTHYLAILEREIQQTAPLFRGRLVTQLHWGGGTPTVLNAEQISRLVDCLHQAFHFTDDAECSIELDPRHIALDLLDHLFDTGFNRLSIGVQDLDPQVQRLINREQDEAFIAEIIQRAREVGFRSIHLDLIYGLPQQTPTSFFHTLQRIIAWSPDRLSLFNYAHLPNRFPGQHKIKESDLPRAPEKWLILQQSIAQLLEAGYNFIGMDHFAKPDDELFKAQLAGQLQRNFQGYTTHKACELLGLGVSAISALGDSYSQNQKVLATYEAQVTAVGHGLWRGLNLSADDCLRRAIIQTLICHFKLDIASIENEYNLCFADYFAIELTLLAPLAADGLLDLQPQQLTVTPQGRLLIRQICLCFDRYSRQQAKQLQFSRLI